MEELFTIIKNEKIADRVYEMQLKGDTSKISAPGQFVNIKVEPYYLRRPISVCDYNEQTVTIIYKVVGKGTEMLASYNAGKTIDVLTGLGNGYDISKMGPKILLAGGGVGVPPMYGLAKRLIASGREVCVLLGFNSKNEVFYDEKFKELGCEVSVYTMDGSYGNKGLVTDGIQANGYEQLEYCACGPLPMLKALVRCLSKGHLSLEARMGCGFGACMGCSIETKNGTKRVCKEGPVFESEELLWKD